MSNMTKKRDILSLLSYVTWAEPTSVTPPCSFQVKAQSDFTKKETEVFLQYVQDYRLERQLMALYNRLMGVSALTDQPTLLEELILSRKPKRWELREFCVKVCEGGGRTVKLFQMAVHQNNANIAVSVWTC